MCSVRHSLEIFQLISSQKLCHYLVGDKGGGGKANNDKVRQGGRGGKDLGWEEILEFSETGGMENFQRQGRNIYGGINFFLDQAR